MRAAIHVFSGRIRETLFFPLGTGCHVISPSLAPKRGGGEVAARMGGTAISLLEETAPLERNRTGRNGAMKG